MSYLLLATIQTDRDKLLMQYVTQNYIDRAANEIEFIALKNGVQTEDISDPLHQYVKEFMIAYIFSEVAGDLAGNNIRILENGINGDVYFQKQKFYEKKAESYREKLTKEIFLNTADQPIEFASQNIQLFRG